MVTNVELLSILNKWFWTVIDLSINIHKVRFSPTESKNRVSADEKHTYGHKKRKIKEWPFKKGQAVSQMNNKKRNTSCSKVIKMTHKLNCPNCNETLTISLEVEKKGHDLGKDKVMTV